MGLCRSMGIHTTLHGPFISPDASTIFSWIKQAREDSRGPKQKSNWETKHCRSAIRFKVGAHIPHFYFIWGLSFLWRGGNEFFSQRMVSDKKNASSPHQHCILAKWWEKECHHVLSLAKEELQEQTTNQDLSVNFSMSVSWKTLMGQWWCWQRNLQQ